MKRTVKRAFAALLSFIMLLSLLPLSGVVSYAENEIGGTCGDDLTWALDLDSGVLTVSGTGDMANYGEDPADPAFDLGDSIEGEAEDAGEPSGDLCEPVPEGSAEEDFAYSPWHEFSAFIKSVVIENGVAGIGNNAFLFCDGITSVILPDSVARIGRFAFGGCSGLTFVHIPSTVTSIGEHAFDGCANLQHICSDLNFCEADIYAKENGIGFIICEGHEPVVEREPVRELREDGKFYIDDEAVPAYYGLVEYEGDYYYIKNGARIVRSETIYISKTNKLKLPNGKPIPKGIYEFDADGKLIIKDGIQPDGRYYIEGISVSPYYGLVEWEGDLYYIRDNAQIVRSKTCYVNTTNGLTLPNGKPVQRDYYEFDGDGKLTLKQGIRPDGRYYIDNEAVPAYYGLVEWEGGLYYIRDNARIVRSRVCQVNNTNGLNLPNGEPVKSGSYYEFDDEGKLIMKQGIQSDGRYYIDDVAVPSYYGLVEWEGDFYYIRDNARIVRSKICQVNTTNGLTLPDGTPIPKGSYEFDTDGKLIMKQGVQEDGSYCVNGIPVPSYYGLVEDGGSYYYVRDNARIVSGRVCRVNTTNGLTFPDGTPIPRGEYTFDAQGRMVY